MLVTIPHPLMSFGYTRRQAEWITLVMQHSGVFLRRQFLEFLDSPSGGIDQRLLSLIVEQGHAIKLPYHGRERVYHVRARPMYACIGQEHSRLRRALPSATVAQRLLILDFLLREPRTYLASEEAKVACLTERFGLHLEQLPHRVYEADRPSGKPTTRYFVERYPIAVRADGGLTFIVPDLVPHSGATFTSFLADYTLLLRAISDVQVVYVTGQYEGTTVAERIWKRTFAPRALVDDVERLHRHFTVRRALREHDYGQVSASDLKEYAADAERFAVPEYVRLYDDWIVGGMDVLRRAHRARGGFPARVNAPAPAFTFRHVALPWKYYCGGIAETGPVASRRRRR